MWFKKKIKEEPKGRLYGNRYNSDKNFSVWDGMSFIEQLCLIVLPCMLCFMFYVMLEMTGLIWWIRLLISIGIVTSVLGLIVFIVNLFMRDF